MPTKRSLVMIYILSILTFGIYLVYWFVKTKNELNGMGARIPTAWLLIIPIANIYWLYKYAEGFAKVTKKESTILWFLLFLFVGIVVPAIVQSELNKLAK
jgi:ABC-type transport system involved in cytochrome c biogenesis permease subunit